MKAKALITMAVALGGLAFGGCAAGEPEEHNTRAVEQGLECNTMTGVNTMKASLAVAMAEEIGRIDPANDMFIAWWGEHLVTLHNFTLEKCRSRGFGDCDRTRSILNMARSDVNNEIPQHIFNATTFREELRASFERQRNHEQNLARNEPWKLPGWHETHLDGENDYGACGSHFEFATSGDKVWNLKERMPFFGGDQNPFIDFRSWDSHIAIDPTGTMEGDTTTTSGMCNDVCYGYGSDLKNKRGQCCFCNGGQGILRRASWDYSMTYCKM